jgi:hypothetical protein
MLLITVLFNVCLGPRCSAVEIITPEMPSLHYCQMRGGQEVAAAWISQHEGWRVSGRITCMSGVGA